ncbi:MAG: alpha/beta hydrolase fold-domain-containing protein [Benjaminiella poitrasii]|nr:MAG: alpha/beta hydrolase fold-domain-containing protein [Benjaminiella poitrasii]
MYVATQPLGSENSWIHKLNKRDVWEGVWIAPHLKSVLHAEETAPDQDLIILYFHGGGFIQGHATMYMEAFQLIINQLKQDHQLQARILSVEYSLSPEEKWPKAGEECLEAYRYLIHDLGVSPFKVILAGDSAGGNLVASTLLRLKNEQQKRKERLLDDASNVTTAPLPLPGGAALLSPWLDLSASSRIDDKKDIICNQQLEMFASNYLTKSLNIKESLISPIHGDFHGIHCPLLVAYADQELLRPSIERWIAELKKHHDNVSIIQGQEATHVWLICRQVAKTKESFEQDLKLFIQWVVNTVAS